MTECLPSLWLCSGLFCETPPPMVLLQTSPCDNYECQNGAQCIVAQGEPVCRCLAGFAGQRCEKLITVNFVGKDSYVELPSAKIRPQANISLQVGHLSSTCKLHMSVCLNRGCWPKPRENQSVCEPLVCSKITETWRSDWGTMYFCGHTSSLQNLSTLWFPDWQHSQGWFRNALCLPVDSRHCVSFCTTWCLMSWCFLKQAAPNGLPGQYFAYSADKRPEILLQAWGSEDSCKLVLMWNGKLTFVCEPTQGYLFVPPGSCSHCCSYIWYIKVYLNWIYWFDFKYRFISFINHSQAALRDYECFTGSHGQGQWHLTVQRWQWSFGSGVVPRPCEAHLWHPELSTYHSIQVSS